MEGNGGRNHTSILKWQCFTWNENKSQLRGNLHCISTTSPLYNIKHKGLKLRLASLEQAIWIGWVPVALQHASFIKHKPEIKVQLRVHTCMLQTNALMTAECYWRKQAKKCLARTYKLTYQITWHSHFKAIPWRFPSLRRSYWWRIRKFWITRMRSVIFFSKSCVPIEGEEVRIVSGKGWLFLRVMWISRQDWHGTEGSATSVWLCWMEWEWGSDARRREIGVFLLIDWIE